MFGIAVDGPVQIAYAVDDVVAAAQSWRARGAGPFFVREHIAVSNARMHGEPAAFDHSSAYGQWGNVMIELICEHHTEADRIGPTNGVHHLAFFVPDLAHAQATLTAAGCNEVLYAEAGSTGFAMHADTNASGPGHLIEIYVANPNLRNFYAMVRDAATTSPSAEPVHFL